MTVINGLGWNVRSTPYKQFALNGALGHLLGSSVSVAMKARTPCVVCDMTAGPGSDPHGQEGSPLILARHLDAWRARGHAVKLICVDRKAEYIAQLRARLASQYPDLPVAFFTTQADALASVPRGAVGLTYWDPTRYNDLDRDLLARFGRSHNRMDILITRECLAGYRMQRADHCPDTLTIQDYLALTGKRCNYIMQYAKHGWWSLGFADNWVDRPAKKLRGFCNVESDEGRALYRKWTAEATPDNDGGTAGDEGQGATLW